MLILNIFCLCIGFLMIEIESVLCLVVVLGLFYECFVNFLGLKSKLLDL